MASRTRLTRTFVAGRELLFEAYTRPDLLTQWYGARGWNLVDCEIEICSGLPGGFGGMGSVA